MDTIQRDDYAKFKKEVPKGATLIVSFNDTLNGMRLRHNQTIYEIPQDYLQDSILRNSGNVSKSLARGKKFGSFMKLECAEEGAVDKDKFCAVVENATVKSYRKLSNALHRAQGGNHERVVTAHITELAKSDGEAAETMKEFIAGVQSQSLPKAVQEETERLLVNRSNFDYKWIWKEKVHDRNDRVMKLVAKEKYGSDSNKNINKIIGTLYPAEIMQSLQNKSEAEREMLQDNFLDNVESFLLKVQANPQEESYGGGFAVLLSGSATVAGTIMGREIGQPRNANPLLAMLTDGAVIFADRTINDTIPSYPESRQLDSALDMIVRRFHERLEPSQHVDSLVTSSLRSAATGSEISPPSMVVVDSNLRRRTPSSGLFMENSPERENIRVIERAIEQGEKRGIAIKNLQSHLDDVETFLRGTSNKSTQTEAQEPRPEHEKADRPLPLTLREHRALEKNKEKSIQALENQIDQLGQVDLDAVQWDLAAKRFSAMKGTSEKSTQTEAHAESSQSRGRSTSATRLSGLQQAQGAAARSPSRDSQRSR